METHPVPASPQGLQEGPAGLRRLLDTMGGLGMPTSGLQIRYEEEDVYYPGGSYTNRNIVVSNGLKTERFSADLTDRNPTLTAVEIQRYFGIGASAAPNGLIRNL